MHISPKSEWIKNEELRNEPLLLTNKYCTISMENPMEIQTKKNTFPL